MKNFKMCVFSLTTTLFLISCGGGGDTTEGYDGDSSHKSTEDKGIIVISCDGSGKGLNDKVNYTSLKENDTLVSLSDNTKLVIINSSNGSKKVCVKTTVPSGRAKIVRAK